MGFPNAPAAGVRPVHGNKKPVTLFGSGVTDCHNTEALLDQKEVVRNCFLTKTFLNKQACIRTHVCTTHMRTHTHHHQVEVRCVSVRVSWAEAQKGAESCPESDGGGGRRGRGCVFPLLCLPVRAHQPCHPRPGGTSRDLGVWRWICPSRRGGGASSILTGPRPEHTMSIRLTNPRAPSTASRDPQASILLITGHKINTHSRGFS